ncbi:restriction endonuclease [Streptomyces sp. NPDC006326]|uniref:restriction endonuclease n=1 Tax=Streptomyces sp. NPDC006326 TaxID=3156752 RepID=UPI0033BEA1A6
MTVPVRRVRPGRRRHRFSTRVTAWWFALVALTVCTAGFTVRVLAGAAAEHPAGAVIAVLACGAAGAAAPTRRRLRIRRAARNAARTLQAAAEAAADTTEAAARPSVPDAGRPEAGGDPGGGTVDHDTLHAAAPDHAAPDYDALDADAFERAVAALCERDGCRDVRVVGGAGDLGADVLATAPDGRLLVIQCKRYCPTHKVGSQDVQRFGGTCFAVHGAELAVVVTTSDFTQPAAEYAARCAILCFGREALLDWSAGTGPAPWERQDA